MTEIILLTYGLIAIIPILAIWLSGLAYGFKDFWTWIGIWIIWPISLLIMLVKGIVRGINHLIEL